MTEVKLCTNCKTINTSTNTKCSRCKTSVFFKDIDSGTPGDVLSTTEVKNSTPTDLSKILNDENFTDVQKTNALLQAIITKQTETVRAVRWGFCGVGLILLIAFYLLGVKVNLSATAFTFFQN